MSRQNGIWFIRSDNEAMKGGDIVLLTLKKLVKKALTASLLRAIFYIYFWK